MEQQSNHLHPSSMGHHPHGMGVPMSGNRGNGNGNGPTTAGQFMGAAAGQFPPAMMSQMFPGASFMGNGGMSTSSGNQLFPPPTMLHHPAFMNMPALIAGNNGTSSGDADSSGGGMMQMQQGLASQMMNAAQSVEANTNLVPRSVFPMGNTVRDNSSVSSSFNSQLDMSSIASMNPRHSHSNSNSNSDSNKMGNSSPQGSMMGGVPAPVNLPPSSTTAMQVQVVAAAAAAAAAPLKGHGSKKAPLTAKVKKNRDSSKKGDDGSRGVKRSAEELTADQKAKQNRDRNREHARSTRLRKKAFINSLKEQVEILHRERTEEERKRRVAVQQLADIQNVRRTVVRTFLKLHSSFEIDPRKWKTVLDDSFWLKQPVTPYRSFRSVEIENECRVSRGIEAIIADAASMSVMIEGIGSRNLRWMHLKREDFLIREEIKNTGNMPSSIVKSSQLQHAVSSLSSSSGSSTGNGSGGEEDRRQHLKQQITITSRNNPSSSNKAKKQGNAADTSASTKKVSSSSSSENHSKTISNEFHDYNAPSLPDPKLDSGENSTGSESPSDSQGADGNHICTDSSSTDEEIMQPPPKKHRADHRASNASLSSSNCGVKPPQQTGLPPNIARSGGISHTIQTMTKPQQQKDQACNERLSVAPAITLPPFVGLGKRAPVSIDRPAIVVGKVMTSTTAAPLAPNATPTKPNPLSKLKAQTPAKVSSKVTSSSSVSATPTTADDGSSSSSNQLTQIQAYYYVNEDDMVLTDDVLMCPFTFRSQDAVLCGALAECIMPGMLRAQFSAKNKLQTMEMVYDAMGFMQQLERASGNEGLAQIIPNRLEMALSPNTNEARVITIAKPPFLIISVNDVWTRLTKYTQMEVEGKELSILNNKRTNLEAGVRQGKPIHDFSEVCKGRCACSINVHYDKHGRDFVDFVSSYPLTNADDEITHILHIYKELPAPPTPDHEF